MLRLTDKHHSQTLFSYVLVLIIGLFFSITFSGVQLVVAINQIHNPYLDLFFAGITNLGDGVIIVPLILLLLFQKFYWSIALALNGIMQAIVVSIFKRLLFPDAMRPIHFLADYSVHQVAGVNVHRWMSFPSGHTVTIFGVCIFLALCYKNRITTLLLLALATLVALSRVYLLQHFVVDITAGAVIGSLIGALCFFIFENNIKPKWMHQRIEVGLNKERTKQRSISQ